MISRNAYSAGRSWVIRRTPRWAVHSVWTWAMIPAAAATALRPRAPYDQTLGVSSFHRHVRAVTSTTLIQFEKQIRRHEAHVRPQGGAAVT